MQRSYVPSLSSLVQPPLGAVSRPTNCDQIHLTERMIFFVFYALLYIEIFVYEDANILRCYVLLTGN